MVLTQWAHFQGYITARVDLISPWIIGDLEKLANINVYNVCLNRLGLIYDDSFLFRRLWWSRLVLAESSDLVHKNEVKLNDARFKLG